MIVSLAMVIDRTCCFVDERLAAVKGKYVAAFSDRPDDERHWISRIP